MNLNHHLELAGLPLVTFVYEDSEQVLDFSATHGEIAQLAQELHTRFRSGDRVGLLFHTGPRLLATWLAALHAGLEPLILQYPNTKQNLVAWRGSVHQSFFRASLAGIVCAPELERHGLNACKPLFLAEQTSARPGAALPQLASSASLLQMSSGTTGHRKPLRLTLEQVATHVRDYNETMRLETADRIVSWLPLYHDMGFIACFLMPLMLGVPVVMMDPMTWVTRPRRLFEAIEKHKTTVCYMPNFGFEVMAGHAQGDSFRSMRRWISCSETVQAATMQRFATTTATPHECLSACYAMAENIFAVTQQDGFKVVELDGGPAVSCGRAIANVQLKIVDSEIWVRSPTSLVAYLDDDPIIDSEGFYPTGDLGRLIDSELVVLGRKHDLVNIAGKKFLLHELDQKLGGMLRIPDGRAGALARREPSVATELPLFLIEDQDFYLRTDLEEIRGRLAQEIDMESFSVEFVPPGFLTKTSSGKLNRSASLASYEASVQWRLASRNHPGEVLVGEEILRLFGAMPLDQPVESLLDSLGLATLEALLEDADVALDPELSLKTHLDLLREQEEGAHRRGRPAAREHVSIVAVSDGRTVNGIKRADLETLSEAAGAPVTLEYVCVPPVPVLLSDLVFFDYFLPRAQSESYREVVAVLSKIRNASMLIVDDVGELLFGKFAYPALNHRMERSSAADLLVWRWQKYARCHDELPISVVNLWRTHALRNEFIDRLGRYLGVPIFRIACLHSFAELTADWDYVDRRNIDWTKALDIATPGLVSRLADFLRARRSELPRRTGIVAAKPIVPVPGRGVLVHFCSMYVDRAKVERVLDSFDRFCLIGVKSAAPFIRRRLDEMGKPYIETSNRNLRAQGYSDDDFDCVLQVGSWGRVQTAKPVFQIFTAGWDPTLQTAEIDGQPITDAGWFHADPAKAPNELSGWKSVLWLLSHGGPTPTKVKTG